MSEKRTPIEQPDGHVGVQVDWFNGEELEASEILSRDLESTAYLSVTFPNNRFPEDETSEDELFYATPSSVFGWQTHLDSRGVLETIKQVLPERPIKDICCVPQTEDERYFSVKDNPYYTTSVEEALKKDRKELEVYLLEPDEAIVFENKQQDEIYQLHFAFHTNNSFDMSEGLVRTLIEHTAAPDKREAILAALIPLKAFYRKYVEIDFHE